ncbi:TPA: hypothetical protein KNH08_003249 [Serratia fonticola]|nr:hypothetical protein [Serratia fonticola]
MNSKTKTGFFDYLNEASQTVSNWPTWKKDGSDASRFQLEEKKHIEINRLNQPLILKKS